LTALDRIVRTPTLHKKLCELLAAGNTIKTCCDAVGISERVYFDWCEQKVHFSQAVNRARARGKEKLVRLITDAAQSDWRAAAFLLERGWPNEYGKAWRDSAARDEEAKSIPYTLYLNTGGKTVEELTSFPTIQAPEKAPTAFADSDSDLDAGGNGE
jgi:hypothetical protein